MTKEIILTQNKVAFVDDVDFEELSKVKWYAQEYGNTCYAVRMSPRVNGNRLKLMMHRIIIAGDSSLQVDHINGNGLDNRRENLRLVTVRQNLQNRHTKKTSVYPGVSWYKAYGKWRACIRIDRKSKHLGYFATELDAFNAYVKALKDIGAVLP